jgi:hypothetical protein
MKKKREISGKSLTRALAFGAVCLCSFFLVSGCGIYHAAPALPPIEETQGWSGPMVADAENVKIFFVPTQKTITFNTEELDTNLNLLLNEYRESDQGNGNSIEELSVRVPEPGYYVLIIKKTSL